MFSLLAGLVGICTLQRRRQRKHCRSASKVSQKRDAESKLARPSIGWYRCLIQHHREDPATGWPDERYVLVHSIAYLLLNQLALECGNAAASIRERIYGPGTGR